MFVFGNSVMMALRSEQVRVGEGHPRVSIPHPYHGAGDSIAPQHILQRNNEGLDAGCCFFPEAEITKALDLKPVVFVLHSNTS